MTVRDLRRARKQLPLEDQEPKVEEVFAAAEALIKAREQVRREQHRYDAALARALEGNPPRGRQARLTDALGITRDAIRQAVKRHFERAKKKPAGGTDATPHALAA